MNYCIQWPGYLDKDGYGQINSNKESTLRTSRIVLAQRLNRKIREGYQAHHICYSRSCINPQHIEEKTAKENIQDRFFSSRSQFPLVQLSKEDVYLIKYLLVRGTELEKISNFIEISFKDFNDLTKIKIPIELIQYIKEGKVWEYIHLYNWQKVEALVRLNSFFPQTECIEADWGENPNSYAAIQKFKKTLPAHIYAYRIFNRRPIPTGQKVRHIYCDNMRCLRPQHLSLGTQLSNIDDKIRKKRHHRDKILDNQELEILKLIDDQKLSFCAAGKILADKLGRETPFDHKMISSRYYNFKLALGETPRIKQPTQRMLLYENTGLLLEMKEKNSLSYRKTSLLLGEKLRNGKPFEQRLVKEVYLEVKKRRGESPPLTTSELLLLNTDMIKSMDASGCSLRAIAKELTARLNLSKPLHHKQIKSILKKINE